jgi:hypothetical protein
MCVVSMVGKWWQDHQYPQYPWVQPYIQTSPADFSGTNITIGVPQEEFDKLKKEVEDLKELLIRAKEYDRRNGEPDCEMDEKVELIKRIAELVKVDLEEVFG